MVTTKPPRFVFKNELLTNIRNWPFREASHFVRRIPVEIILRYSLAVSAVFLIIIIESTHVHTDPDTEMNSILSMLQTAAEEHVGFVPKKRQPHRTTVVVLMSLLYYRGGGGVQLYLCLTSVDVV